MSALPSFFLACIFGFYLDGVHGLVVGAAIGWALCAVGTWVDGHLQERRDKAASAVLETLEAIREHQAEMGRVLADLPRICRGILDAQQFTHHDQLEMRTPRTEAEWARCAPRLWPLLHRRLVVGYGIGTDRGTAARDRIIDNHISGHSLPGSHEELEAMLKAWKIADQDAAIFGGRRTAG